MSCGSFANLRSAVDTFRTAAGGPRSRYTVENGPSWMSSLSQVTPLDSIYYVVVEAYILGYILTEANRSRREVVVKDAFKCW
jgi:hypothetical protein